LGRQQGARSRAAVLSGTYELPWKVLVASSYTAQQAEYFARIVQVPNALNQLVDIVVEGQAGRCDWVRLLDLRLSKTFTWAGSRCWRPAASTPHRSIQFRRREFSGYARYRF
jgi:hypothetical protein